MAYDIQNKNLELLIHDKVGKNINYYPKSGLSVFASNGNIVITQGVDESLNTIFSQEPSMIDEPSVNSVYELVTTIKSYLTSYGNDEISGGFADYNDFATSQPSGAIIITGGGAAAVIPNDTLGAYTNTQFLPEEVDRLWDPSTNNFDWSDLKVGDMVDIRLDIIVKTPSSNTSIDVLLHLGTGASAYSIPFIQEHNFKLSGNHQITSFNSIYIGDTNTLNNGGQFKITADGNCSVAVNGWYVRCLKRG
jgi:hypothetical protein